MSREEENEEVGFRAVPGGGLEGLLKAMRDAMGRDGDGLLKRKRGGKKAKLTNAEIARFKVLEMRVKALARDLEVTKSKLQIENERIWADLREKYEMFGMNLSYDEAEGVVYEAE